MKNSSRVGTNSINSQTVALSDRNISECPWLVAYLSQCLCINSEAFVSTICCKSTDNIFDKYFVNFSEFTWRDHIDDDIDGVHPAIPWVEDHWLKIDRINLVICKHHESPPWGVWCWGLCQRCVQLSAEQWRSHMPRRDATSSHAYRSGGIFLLD